jgi:PTK7 protein tyrosine kinase 7
VAASRKDGSVNRKPPQPGLPPPLTVAQIIQLAIQVARGMEHLANQRMIHRDLAARNCFITSSLVIKISSPALCKDTYVHDYYKYHDQVCEAVYIIFK